MTWLSGWTNRKSHLITSAAGAGTGYQKCIKVHYGAGVDNNTEPMCDVYCNNKCNTDFGDIRFTDDDGTTLLDFWMETSVASNYAVFWVEVADNLTSANQSIYMYYNKVSQTTTSNGTATFPSLFDHFDDSSLNTTIWTSLGGTPTESGTTMVINAGAEGIRSNATFSNCRMRWSGAQTNANWSYWGLANDLTGGCLNATTFFVYATTIKAVSHDGTYEITDLGDHSNATRTWEIRWVLDVSAEFLIDESSHATHTTHPSPVVKPVQFYDYGGAATLTIDWVFIAKYVNPEPLHFSWGEEEVLEAVAHEVTLIELLAGLDIYSRTKTVHRIKTEILGLSDSKSLIRALFLILTEVLGMVDTKSFGKSLHLSEILGLVDTKSRTKTIYRIKTEILGALDTIYQTKALHRTFTEILGAKDSFSKGVGKVFTEILGAVDSYSRKKTLFRTFLETLGFFDPTLVRAVYLGGTPTAAFPIFHIGKHLVLMSDGRIVFVP